MHLGRVELHARHDEHRTLLSASARQRVSASKVEGTAFPRARQLMRVEHDEELVY